MTAFSTSAARRCDALAIVALVLTGAIAAATFRDYGLGWDDYTHSQYGDLLVALYSSGFTDKRAFSFVNLYMYGGGFDLIAALAAKISPFGLFATRRLVGAAIGLIGLFVTWRLGRRLGGPLAGLIALALLAACPLYYGHMFINAKDGPFAVTSTIALLGIVRAFQEYPRPSPTTVALCGVGIGLAVGSRVMGGFAVIDAALPLPLILAVRRRGATAHSHPSAANEAGTSDALAIKGGGRAALSEMGIFLFALIPGAVLAYLVMGLVWPWGVVDPANPFHAVAYFSRFFEKPWRELFDGRLIYAPDMPRSYVPTLIAVKFPLLLLALGSCGIIGALAATAGLRRSRIGIARIGIGRRAGLLATVLAATLPILVTVLLRPAMYNGIRHFVFVVPPFAVLAGLAAVWILRRLQRAGAVAMVVGALVMMAGIASPVVDMVRLHPYQYTYFNQLVGGVAGAQSRFMLDYWGLSLTQASRQLLDYIFSRGETPPNGKWRIAVCGPHPPVNVALGSGYDTTWDPKGADFAMQLDVFYCARLDAPVLFEVVREGVVYARVYDIRGRSIPTLLSVPGIDQQ